MTLSENVLFETGYGACVSLKTIPTQILLAFLTMLGVFLAAAEQLDGFLLKAGVHRLIFVDQRRFSA